MLFIVIERKPRWIRVANILSQRKNNLALTSSCRIAVSRSLISSRSSSVMATSSSWLCIWFQSSWLHGDNHNSLLLLCNVYTRNGSVLLLIEWILYFSQGPNSTDINTKSLRATFFILRGNINKTRWVNFTLNETKCALLSWEKEDCKEWDSLIFPIRGYSQQFPALVRKGKSTESKEVEWTQVGHVQSKQWTIAPAQKSFCF